MRRMRKEIDTETLQHLWALRKVNEALIEGLKAAIFVIEKEEQPHERQAQSE